MANDVDYEQLVLLPANTGKARSPLSRASCLPAVGSEPHNVLRLVFRWLSTMMPCPRAAFERVPGTAIGTQRLARILYGEKDARMRVP
jgi:hypothetical protein